MRDRSSSRSPAKNCRASASLAYLNRQTEGLPYNLFRTPDFVEVVYLEYPKWLFFNQRPASKTYSVNNS